jgi:Heterokaryon incompatibility protein (HET)
MMWTFIPDPSRDPSAVDYESESTPVSYPVTSIYPYKPIEAAKGIRLLSIEPGSYDDKIICSLFHAPLYEQHEYEALSYVWGNALSGRIADMDVETSAVVYGDLKKNEPVRKVRFCDLVDYPDYENTYYASGGPRKPGRITIDEVEVDVGGELYAALKRLRSGEEPLALWVDALCIDQADSAERAEQVRGMSAIYAHAKRVRVWLGEEVGNEQQAFEALGAIASKIAKLQEEGLERDMQKLAFLQDKEVRGLHWDSLGELLSRAWVCAIIPLLSSYCYTERSAKSTSSIGSGSSKKLPMLLMLWFMLVVIRGLGNPSLILSGHCAGWTLTSSSGATASSPQPKRLA